MKRKQVLLVIGVVILIAAGVIWQTSRVEATGEEAALVPTAEVTRGNLARTLETTGSVVADQIHKSRAPFTAELLALDVEVGDVVEAGQVIATLGTSDLDASIAAKKQEILSLEMERDTLLTEGNLSAVQSLGEAERNVSTASSTLEDNRILHAAGALATVELEKSEEALTEAREALALASSKLAATDLARSQELVELSLERTREELLTLGEQRSEAQWVAEKSGTVLSLSAEAGDTVNESSPLLTLADLSRLVVEADVSEYEVDDLSLGMMVTVVPEGDPTKRYTGTIDAIAPVANDGGTDVTVPVRIAVEDSDTSLRPGVTVSLTVLIERAEDVLMVPYDAVSLSEGQRIVTKVDEEGKETSVVVTTGLDNDLMIAISGEGIAAGDRVKVTVAQTTATDAKAPTGLPVPGMGGGGGMGQRSGGQ